MSSVSLCLSSVASILKAADEPAPVPAAGPRRAGGGPENPELKFRPPPPPVLSPAEEMKTFKIAPGFKVELVAWEPMIETPIALSWDDQGRLFVCEMRGYMHDVDGTGEDQPLGRISRLEDTDGDGKMDKATVFADKLVMPRAVMAVGDGALVSEPPNLIFFHDTDGDGVADKREVVAQNYASAGGQPEHMANSPTWMMDNWIWSSNHSARYRYQGGAFLTAPTQLCSDPSPGVRRQLAFKLSAIPGSEPALTALLSQNGDPLLAEAVASGLAGRELEFLETLAQQPAGKLDAGGIFPAPARGPPPSW